MLDIDKYAPDGTLLDTISLITGCSYSSSVTDSAGNTVTTQQIYQVSPSNSWNVWAVDDAGNIYIATTGVTSDRETDYQVYDSSQQLIRGGEDSDQHMIVKYAPTGGAPIGWLGIVGEHSSDWSNDNSDPQYQDSTYYNYWPGSMTLANDRIFVFGRGGAASSIYNNGDDQEYVAGFSMTLDGGDIQPIGKVPASTGTMSPYWTSATSVAAAPDGTFVMAGYAYNDDYSTVTGMWRLDADGNATPLITFSSDRPESGSYTAYDCDMSACQVAVDNDGNIYAAMNMRTWNDVADPDDHGTWSTVEKFAPDGTLLSVIAESPCDADNVVCDYDNPARAANGGNYYDVAIVGMAVSRDGQYVYVDIPGDAGAGGPNALFGVKIYREIIPATPCEFDANIASDDANCVKPGEKPNIETPAVTPDAPKEIIPTEPNTGFRP